MIFQSLSNFFNLTKSLADAARSNSPAGVRKWMGNADSDNLAINSEALRIAAEAKSYAALETMLQLSGRAAFSTLDFRLDDNYRRVQEIAQTDGRIAKALKDCDVASSQYFREVIAWPAREEFKPTGKK